MSKRILAGALGAACLITSPAMAQQPAPEKCPGKVLASDATGDAKFFTQVPAPSSTDIVEGSIRTADRKTTVSVKVADLTKTVPPYATGLSWYFEYTLDGAPVFVSTTLSADGTVTFETGKDGQTYEPTGPTTGTFDEATDTISMVLPGLTSSTKRYELSAARFVTYGSIGAAGIAFLPGADSATSDDHTTTPCSTQTAS